jgi:beta-mannosidase
MRLWLGIGGDPNRNVLTRKVLPDVVIAHDSNRPYLPSSPYIDEQAWQAGAKSLPEDHLWGPRNYYKSSFYRNAVCHFVSEIGYHGCPAPASVRKFITPAKVWPCLDNDEWTLHSTNPALSTAFMSPADFRVRLMLKQVDCLFGASPATLEEFAFTSQAVQAEAKKFFIERFRSTKWRRTGIIWWNLLDGWPQFSDAVVDWYYVPKLAYHFIKVAQQRVCLMISEPAEGQAVLVASNDTMSPATFSYTVTDLATGGQLAGGQGTVGANAALPLCDMPAPTQQAFWVIRWQGDSANGANHYLAGKPPFEWKQYLGWLKQSGLYPAADLTWVSE